MTFFAISPRTRREIAEVQEWWIAHQDAAPAALEEDFAAVFELLDQTPHVGILLTSRRHKFIRLIQLSRTGCHFYYRDTAPGIEILALRQPSRQLTETKDGVEVSAEDLAAINAGIEEAERGEGSDAFEFLRQLREGTWRDDLS